VKRLARWYSDPIRWIKEDNQPYIEAFLGSREEWEQIPGWDERARRMAAQ